MNKKLESLLMEVASGMEHDSEYDGVNDSYCSFCDQNMSHNEKHDDDCLMLIAREILGDRYHKIIEQKEADRKTEYEKSIEYMNSRQSCPICRKMIMASVMYKHQRDNKRCLEKQRLISMEKES